MANEAASSSMERPAPDQNPDSDNDAMTKSGDDHGATGSTFNNDNGKTAESSVAISDSTDLEKTLEYSDELMDRGSKATEESDYAGAVDCYRRALDIRRTFNPVWNKRDSKNNPRVEHFGEFAPECVNAYGEYGRALLDKYHATGGHANALAEGDEDKTELYLAGKMLETALAIVDEHSSETTEMVDILSALAAKAWETEEYETSVSHFLKALSILQPPVDPDTLLIAELYFRIRMCMEDGSDEEAIQYCEKAKSICQSRMDRLMEEIDNFLGPDESPTSSESSQSVEPSSSASLSGDSLAGESAEIERLAGFCNKLGELLEHLKLEVSRLSRKPSTISESEYFSFLPRDHQREVDEEVKAAENIPVSVAMCSSQTAATRTGGNPESPTVSTASTDGAPLVTHEPALMSTDSDSSTMKKPSTGPSSNIDDGTAS